MQAADRGWIHLSVQYVRANVDMNIHCTTGASRAKKGTTLETESGQEAQQRSEQLAGTDSDRAAVDLLP